jgi:two-component system chemotaxis response regulator CheB
MGRDLVAVGASAGGLRAVGALLEALPDDFSGALVLVQHRPADSVPGMLVRALGARTSLPVCEAGDKDPIEPGQVHVAPADYHLLVEPDHFELSLEGPVSYSRPSIDVLFESVADSYGDRAIGVLLTGANSDGAQGLLRLRERGALTVAQDPAEAEAPVMPAAAIDLGAAERVCPLDAIAPLLAEACRAGSPA